MKRLNSWAVCLCLFLIPACGQQLVEFRNPDGGKSDAEDATNADLPAEEAAGYDSRAIDLPATDEPRAEVPIDGSGIDLDSNAVLKPEL